MPLIRRVPKRGFTSPGKKEFRVINLKELNQFESNAEVHPAALKALGFIKKESERVKILGSGELKIPLTIKAHSFSKTATEKIEKAGGKAIKILECPNTRKERAPERQNTRAPVKK